MARDGNDPLTLTLSPRGEGIFYVVSFLCDLCVLGYIRNKYSF